MVQPSNKRLVTESSVGGHVLTQINSPGATKDALEANFVPKWKPSTAYLAGAAVLSPSGDVVTARSAFTSGGSYSATNWLTSSSYAKPLGLSAVALGDSQTAQGGVGGASDRGWFVWMNGLLGQPWASFKNSGVNGDTLAQMLARVQTDVITYNPDIVFLWGGKNTISTGATFASIQTTYTQILDALLAAGINRVVVVTDPPHNGRSAAERAVRDQLNDWLRRLPQLRKQVIATIDAYSAVVDPATGDYAAGMAYDLLHPSTAGAQAIGRVAANVMAPLLPKVNTLPTGVDSLNLLGIAGSFIGARTTGIATGLSPDWSEYHAGGDSTFVKVPRTDGVQGEWQQVTTVAAQHTQQIFKDITTGFAVGDTLYGMTEYQVDTVGETISGGYPNWSFQIGFLDGAGSAIPAPPYPVQALTSTDGRKTPPAGTFIARTPDFVVPAGTVKLRVQFLDYAGATTIRHGRTVLRKVV